LVRVFIRRFSCPWPAFIEAVIGFGRSAAVLGRGFSTVSGTGGETPP
jgi:hypothetical protein